MDMNSMDDTKTKKLQAEEDLTPEKELAKVGESSLEQADKLDQADQKESKEVTNKRTRDEKQDEDTDGLSADDFAKMSRSERKRHREKKRRSDVNKGFDELMTLLLEIDPHVRAEAEERARRGQWKGNLGAHEDNLLSRVDLISRAVEVLRRVHRENEERKLIIANLSRAGVSTDLGTGAVGGAAGMRNDEAARLLQGFPSSNSDVADVIALRAAAERNQMYNRALLEQLNNTRAASTLVPNQQYQDLLSAQGAMQRLRSQQQDYLGLAGSANPLAGLVPSSGNPSLFAAGLGHSVSGNSALTRQYLQLLQSRQDAATAAQLAEAKASGDAASLLRGKPKDQQQE